MKIEELESMLKTMTEVTGITNEYTATTMFILFMSELPEPFKSEILDNNYVNDKRIYYHFNFDELVASDDDNYDILTGVYNSDRKLFDMIIRACVLSLKCTKYKIYHSNCFESIKNMIHYAEYNEDVNIVYPYICNMLEDGIKDNIDLLKLWMEAQLSD